MTTQSKPRSGHRGLVGRFGLAGLALALSLSSALGAPTAARRSPVVEAVEKIRPAVVNISAEEVVVIQRDPFFEDFFSRFLEGPPRRRQYKRTSLGSGVIVRSEGYVVTNAHVVKRGDRITVVLADEREFEATLVGTDDHADLAVLRIEGDDLPHAEFGRSHDLMIGETVIAIGNPFGFSHTVTTGVISALNRSLRLEGQTYFDFVQTDASINPGNSGGPLLNVEGELIAINTAIWGRAENIGFAIPAKRASRIVSELIAHGRVRLAYLGLQVQELTPALADALQTQATRGVVIRSIDPGSPAATSELSVGDIVLSLDGHAIRNRHEFEERIAGAGVGSDLSFALLRNDKRIQTSVVAQDFTDERLDQLGWRRLGLRVDTQPRRNGLVIRAVGKRSHAAQKGIQPGDELLAIGQNVTPDPASFRRAVSSIRGFSSVILVVRRGHATYRVPVPINE